MNVQGGDLDAFERIVVRHQARAWHVAYRFIGDSAEAEDLAQETFLHILDAANRYRPTASFRTYLFRVLTRLCLDYRRRKRPIPANPLPDLMDEQPSPMQRTSRTERDSLVQAALDALPADHRMALVLRYFEGLSSSEMGQVMGRSVKAVERLLSRGRTALEPRLRNLLGE